ncbi:hypothetical protein BDY19DRAFT_930603 [Irpex rosettiformis]|uniref:Uncharacterized protein n=1 Tax=Irpex rosettiformis TaxID=378272 RepID=A0ACB8UAP1_9APHY|nr:hypothetical protein BDY19DRAFT_930603 [Irpex rosettiformis]
MVEYEDDMFTGSSSRYNSKKSSSHRVSSANGKRSPSATRGAGASLAEAFDDDDAGHGMHSLAHELAYALMPESGGSKLLAEELGIEYDEGAQGIDESEPPEDVASHNDGETLAEAFGSSARPIESDNYEADAQPGFDPAFEAPSKSQRQTRVPEQDPMVVLAEDLESTDKFISQLRRLDTDHGSQPNLERLASDIIRRIDDTARERESQVRELLEYEREFRRIAGEIGGNEALSHLDGLDDLVSEDARPDTAPSQDTRSKPLDSIHEEPESAGLPHTADWEADLERDRTRLEEDDYEMAMHSPSLNKTSFTVPTLDGPPTPKVTVSQLAHFRSFTATVASSLATISEQTQVNSAATTEAGRKIRALKNKMGGWRAEWDSAERSRIKIEKWEAGLVDSGDSTPVVIVSVPSTPTRLSRSRVDGRTVVKEHLEAFERALLEANTRTQAIIAAVS